MQPAEDTSSPATSVLYLPDTLKDWPWKRAINPHYQEILVECEAWFSKFMPSLDELHIADINALAQPGGYIDCLRIHFRSTYLAY
jgi:hypothetical protein